MNTKLQKRSLRTTFNRRVATAVSPQTRELMSLGRVHGWDFQVLGNAPMPPVPVRVGDWLLVPASQDSSQIPARCLRRVKRIYDAGIKPRGFVLAHEAPKLLTDAVGAGEETSGSMRMRLLQSRLRKALVGLASFLGVVALGLLAIAAAAIIAYAVLLAAFTLLLPLALVGGLAMGVDPVLVAVTDDGFWVEIDRWEV